MKIIDKIAKKNMDFYHEKPATIVFFGDSVTHGCFECYFEENGAINTIFDAKSGYPTRVNEILHVLYPSAQINIINSGISGDNAPNGNARFERDVLPYNPDLVVVAFGLNDSTGGKEQVEKYTTALGEIFDKTKSIGAECIFVAQNMMCTKISPHLTDERDKGVAKGISELENNGTVEYYFQKAVETAKARGVQVCDMYSKWRTMYNHGVNVTELLANKFNHPIREMHYYTAIELIETMFKD